MHVSIVKRSGILVVALPKHSLNLKSQFVRTFNSVELNKCLEMGKYVSINTLSMLINELDPANQDVIC